MQILIQYFTEITGTVKLVCMNYNKKMSRILYRWRLLLPGFFLVHNFGSDFQIMLCQLLATVRFLHSWGDPFMYTSMYIHV